jgi:hypothetical protein
LARLQTKSDFRRWDEEMTKETPIGDRWIRIPIAVAVVLIGMIANLSIDMIA